MKVPVLLPHQVLAYLFETVGVEISQAAVDEYWSHCKQYCPWASSSEMDGAHLPISLYGDSARYGQNYDMSKVTGCFMSLVLWRPKSTRMSQFLLWNLDGQLSLGSRSHNPLFAAIVRSLNAAFYGRTPNGASLPHKFCVTQYKGDWEFHWQTWRLARYWKTRYICWRCDAENHHLARHSMADVSEAPSWRATELSHNQFVVSCMKPDEICTLIAGLVF